MFDRRCAPIFVAVMALVACNSSDGSPSDDSSSSTGSQPTTSLSATSPDTSTTSPTTATTTDPDDGSSTAAADSTGTPAACTVDVILEVDGACLGGTVVGDADGGLVEWTELGARASVQLQRLDEHADLDREAIPELGASGVVAAGADDYGVLVDVDGDLRFGVLGTDGLLATTPVLTDIAFVGGSIAPTADGWVTLVRHTLYQPTMRDLIEFARFDADGVLQGEAVQLADVGDDVGYFGATIVARDTGSVALWNDFDDDDSMWKLAASLLAADGTVDGPWTAPFDAAICGAWIDAIGFTVCASVGSAGHVERRSADTGALTVTGWAGDAENRVVAAAPSAMGPIALTMAGAYNDAGPTTIAVARLDDQLQPVADPVVVDDLVARLEFSVAGVGDAIVVGSCAFGTNNLRISRVVCE